MPCVWFRRYGRRFGYRIKLQAAQPIPSTVPSRGQLCDFILTHRFSQRLTLTSTFLHCMNNFLLPLEIPFTGYIQACQFEDWSSGSQFGMCLVGLAALLGYACIQGSSPRSACRLAHVTNRPLSFNCHLVYLKDSVTKGRFGFWSATCHPEPARCLTSTRYARNIIEHCSIR